MLWGNNGRTTCSLQCSPKSGHYALVSAFDGVMQLTSTARNIIVKQHLRVVMKKLGGGTNVLVASDIEKGCHLANTKKLSGGLPLIGQREIRKH